MLRDLMTELAKDLELTPFVENPPGTYSMSFGDDFTIQVSQPLGGGISITALISGVPKNQQDVFFTQALLANLFGQGTKNAILGLNTDATQLTLSKDLEYNIDYKEFKNEFEDFINVCDFWHDEALGIK